MFASLVVPHPPSVVLFNLQPLSLTTPEVAVAAPLGEVLAEVLLDKSLGSRRALCALVPDTLPELQAPLTPSQQQVAAQFLAPCATHLGQAMSEAKHTTRRHGEPAADHVCVCVGKAHYH